MDVSKNLLTPFFQRKALGFTLIELMIALAVLGVLAAVAIPSYLGYIRRGYVNEAVTGISNIKAAEEQYFNMNECYTEADPLPVSIPSGTSVQWPAPVPAGSGWDQAALAVRPDARVRFQYRVYATNAFDVGDSCDSPSTGTTIVEVQTAVDTALVELGPTDGSCISSGVGTAAGALVNTTVFPNHWYVVVAQGDLDGDPERNTILVSAIDDSRIIYCFEGE